MSKSHAMMHPVNQDKEFYINYIKEEINSVKGMDDLKKLGESMKMASHLEKIHFDELLSQKYTQGKLVSQLAALCIILPNDIAPKQLNQLIQKVIPDLVNIPKDFQTGIAYKYVDTALITGDGQKLLEDGVLVSLFNDSPAYYAGPYLYLLASTKSPNDIFKDNSIPFSKIHRNDAMILYYYGINLLLLNNYNKSEQQLLRAYRLARKTKCIDFLMPIVQKLSLASFLNHTPYKVFCKYLKLTHQPQDYGLYIWDLDHDCMNRIKDREQFYIFFHDEIIQERTRRIIFDYAETCSVMRIQSLIEACENPNVETILNSLKKSGELKFAIENENIKFIKHSYQDQINFEQAKVDELLGTLQT